jgi:hypothetical protein
VADAVFRWRVERLSELVARGGPSDAKVIGELRRRYDTEQLSALTSS